MTPVEHLDLATVLKVSRAVSGETDLEKLIATILRLSAPGTPLLANTPGICSRNAAAKHS